MKYILVTGGVISGIGKGVIASSLGTLLNWAGFQVTSIKIDPYINIDAGTFSPYEHGEVFVLDDGGEVDLDLGNYERFLDITLHRDNNITTGKVYKQVIENERRGNYLGKTVMVVPHITDAIQEWVERVSKIYVKKNKIPEICIIELGGTIGDIEGMPFVEAFRQFQFRVKRENFCCAHVSLVPSISVCGEQKTKPTQASVRELRGLGLSPDLIFCRSEEPIGQDIKEKISNFCHVAPNHVICIHNLKSIYHVPMLLENHGLLEFFRDRLQLKIPDDILLNNKIFSEWKSMVKSIDTTNRTVKIVLVGKYTKFEDSYTSVKKALEHACMTIGYNLDLKYIEACHLEKQNKIENQAIYHEAWRLLCLCDGVVVPGGFGPRGIEGKIRAISWCREKQKPFLGICLGLQTAVIEFARNVLGLKDANSTENDADTKNPVVIDMPEYHPVDMGGTMRLGQRTTVFTDNKDSVIKKLYGSVKSIDERHRHRYEVNPNYIEQLESKGLMFVGTDDGSEKDESKKRMEILELKNHPYYVGVQFHPEYLSRPLKPSPPFLGLILASVGKLQSYLNRGCHLSPREMSDISSDDEEIIKNIVINDENGLIPIKLQNGHHNHHHNGEQEE